MTKVSALRDIPKVRIEKYEKILDSLKRLNKDHFFPSFLSTVLKKQTIPYIHNGVVQSGETLSREHFQSLGTDFKSWGNLE